MAKVKRRPESIFKEMKERERKRQVVDQRLGEWSLSLAKVKKKGGKRAKEKKSSYATLSV